MTPSQLKLTAKRARAYATLHPWKPGMPIRPYRVRLADGPAVEFYLDARSDSYTMTIARDGADPGETECKEVCAAFGAPLLWTSDSKIKARDGIHVKKYSWKREHDRGGPRELCAVEVKPVVQARLDAVTTLAH